ncbi:hypothetical protein Lser_V15G31978 [Lactuca serriola]
MGASLCCMKPSQPPFKYKEPTCSTIVIVKSPEKVAMKTRKRVDKEEEKGEDGGSVTLKEWLANSPNNNLDHLAMNSAMVQVVNTRSPSLQVMNSPEVRSTEFYTPMISFSLENVTGKLEKVDERDEDENKDNEGSRLIPILKRNPSDKGKKTVAFQDNDIFYFYSPEDTFGGN